MRDGRSYEGRWQNDKMCTFCSKIGHTIDVFYKKHGYLPHYKNKNALNHCTTFGEGNFVDDEGEISKREVNEEPNLLSPPELHKALLAIIQQSGTHHIRIANWINNLSNKTIVHNPST